jgi:hypothetical protein
MQSIVGNICSQHPQNSSNCHGLLFQEALLEAAAEYIEEAMDRTIRDKKSFK